MDQSSESVLTEVQTLLCIMEAGVWFGGVYESDIKACIQLPFPVVLYLTVSKREFKVCKMHKK